MKWFVIILVILGLLAAVATAILVGALRINPADSPNDNLPKETQVILAGAPLSAMSIITSRDIVEKTISKGNLEEGYLTTPIQAIGRVLAISGSQC